MEPSGSRDPLPSNVTATPTVPVLSGPALAMGGWFGSDVEVVVELLVEVVVGRLVEVDDVVLVEVDDVVGRLVDVDVELLVDVDEDVLLEVLVDELVVVEVDELVDVVFFPPPRGCVVVDVEDVDVVVGRLVDVDDVVEVDVVLGRLVDVEVEDEDVLEVEVDVVVGLAASAGTTRTSASRTLPRTFPPG